MKHKKFSDAILCGYEMVDGRQHFGDYSNDKVGKKLAVCVLGAAALCKSGEPSPYVSGEDTGEVEFAKAFKDAWGCMPNELNDDGMPWEHIYGMAKAIGL